MIPADIAIPPDKLQYILHHEALHYFHRDHFTKLAVRLLSFVYWWNPFCIVLQKQTNLLLEMSIDRKVVCGNPVVRDEYADCLLYMRKQALVSAAQIPNYLKKDCTFLIRPRSCDLKKRHTMLFHGTSPGKKAAVAFLMTALVFSTYPASHLYILEARYYPPEVMETTFSVTPDNARIIQLSPGIYEIYVAEICLDFYPKGIKIYNARGELIGET